MPFLQGLGQFMNNNVGLGGFKVEQRCQVILFCTGMQASLCFMLHPHGGKLLSNYFFVVN